MIILAQAAIWTLTLMFAHQGIERETMATLDDCKAAGARAFETRTDSTAGYHLPPMMKCEGPSGETWIFKKSGWENMRQSRYK